MRPPKGKSGGNAGTGKTKSRQRDGPRSEEIENDASDFQSPSAQDDVTDYGLEFTTSRLTLTDHNGQSRNSTLRPRKQPQAAVQRQPVVDAPTDYEDDDDEDADDDDQENQSPASPGRPVPASVRSNENQRTTNPVPVPATTATRRKQSRPVNRAKRINKEIARLRNSPDLLIPRLPFSRLVREILYHYSGVHQFRMTGSALEALQHSSEMFLTQRFQDSYLLTMHRSRVTLEVRDMALMAFFCKESVV